MSEVLLAYYANQLDRTRKLRARTRDAVEWMKLTKLMEEYERQVRRLDREAGELDRREQPFLNRT